MTDNDIIKALTCCSFACEHCPYKSLKDEDKLVCLGKMTANTLDLIHRKDAEIERLREEKQEIKDNFYCQQTVYLDLSKIIKEQADELKTAKSEAIKEFAERLKDVVSLNIAGQMHYIILESYLDNLVKEMEGSK